MQFRFLIAALLTFTLSACVTSNYNVGNDAELKDIAILFTHSEGSSFGKEYNIVMTDINGKSLSGKSKRYLRMKPGEYEIAISGYTFNQAAYFVGAAAGGIAGGGSIGAVTSSTSLALSESYDNSFKDNKIKATLEAGKIYVIDPVIKLGEIQGVRLISY